MPTLKEIAQACGVSYGTVSRAFNPNASVKPEVRARILKYAQSVNYTPNLMAQSLKKRRTGLIGVILPTPQNSFSEVLFEFNMNLLRSCEIALKQRGYRLIVSFASTPEEELTALQQSSGIHVEGVLLQPIDHSNEAMIRSMQSTTAFIQCNGPFYSDMDRIYPEDYDGTFTAVNYLLQRGHRRILCICGDVRSRYFAQALAERGLTADPLQILSSNADEAEITKRLLEYRPTAVFAVAGEINRRHAHLTAERFLHAAHHLRRAHESVQQQHAAPGISAHRHIDRRPANFKLHPFAPIPYPSHPHYFGF